MMRCRSNRNVVSFPTSSWPGVNDARPHDCAGSYGVRSFTPGTRSSRLAQRSRRKRSRAAFRSEEHTSELQSQSNLVCRLLLEKKKTTHTTHTMSSSSVNNMSLITYVKVLLGTVAFLACRAIRGTMPHMTSLTTVDTPRLAISR